MYEDGSRSGLNCQEESLRILGIEIETLVGVDTDEASASRLLANETGCCALPSPSAEVAAGLLVGLTPRW
jgi:hypothetical protein